MSRTTISVLGGLQAYSCCVMPYEPLMSSVTTAVSNASANLSTPLQPAMVVFSDSNAPVTNWQTRSVGAENITVVAIPQSPAGSAAPSLLEVLLGRIVHLEAANAEHDVREAARDVREAEMVAQRLRNAVGQVLLHACGQQDFRGASTGTYFQVLGVTHPGVQRLAQLMQATAAEVARQADAAITRRNSAIHPSSQQALDEEVAAVQRCITPALQQLCRWECRFIQGYANIKAAFPGRFPV